MRPSTYESYEMQVKRHIIPSLGAIVLERLQPLHLQKHYAHKLSSGLSVRSVQYQHTIIRQALGHAVKWMILTRNVAELVDSPRRLGNKEGLAKKEARALTPLEVEKLLKVASGTWYYNFIQIAMNTGLRRGELIGLRWEDVDLERRYIRVRQSLQWVGGKIVIQEPKTEKSVRTIPFLRACVPIFRETKKEQAANRLLYGKDYKDKGMVFCQPDGSYRTPNNVTSQVSKLMAKAGIEGASLHSLRHTFASNLIAKGVPIEQVQALLGHEDISTTMGIYHHILPGVLENAIARLE